MGQMIMTTGDFLYILVGLLVGLLIKSFLPKYIGKKGENLATKEDISEITNKIETVKHDYANQLEATKAELSAQLNTHGFRYEKEYEILNELTALLVDVRNASLSLRPTLDFQDPSKDKEEIKKERLNRLFEAQKALYLYSEKKRPFYINEIYQSILSLENITHIEAVKYQYGDPFGVNNFKEYWKVAKKNHEEIASMADVAMKIIRERVTKWETLS